ncbi:MAG: hypothetical protein ABI972_30780 [Acidobacteriota bacterium]
MEKRLSHGLSLLGSYIFSKTISDSRGESGAGGTSNSIPQDPLNLRAERSLADEHRAQRFVLSYVYELPFGRGRSYMTDLPRAAEAVIGNWTLAGITALSSGRLVNLSVAGNPANTGSTDRPDVVGEWRLSSDERSLDRWFNTAAFVPNQAFMFGNAGRNLLEGPGEVNFDFAIYKGFRLTEGIRLQLRAEAFNVTNTPAFGPPVAQVGASDYGTINSADRSRNLQFGLKVLF